MADLYLSIKGKSLLGVSFHEAHGLRVVGSMVAGGKIFLRNTESIFALMGSELLKVIIPVST